MYSFTKPLQNMTAKHDDDDDDDDDDKMYLVKRFILLLSLYDLYYNQLSKYNR